MDTSTRADGARTAVRTVDPRIEVNLVGRRVVGASARTAFMRYSLARPLCELIEDTARSHEADALVMDMGALSKASPRAGAYAVRRLRQLPLRRIALVGGNGFMRAFAGTVLRLGRFPEFRFFTSSAEAVDWADRP